MITVKFEKVKTPAKGMICYLPVSYNNKSYFSILVEITNVYPPYYLYPSCDSLVEVVEVTPVAGDKSTIFVKLEELYTKDNLLTRKENYPL